MKKIGSIVKHYVKESLDSLFVDQIVSLTFGALVTWVLKNNLQVIDNEVIPVHINFLILGIAFFIVYVISVATQLRPHRYKFMWTKWTLKIAVTELRKVVTADGGGQNGPLILLELNTSLP